MLAEVISAPRRIDAVHAAAITDARRRVVEVHRPSLDLTARAAVTRAQRALATLASLSQTAGRIHDVGWVDISIETLLPDGDRGNGDDHAIRMPSPSGWPSRSRPSRPCPTSLPTP